MKPFQTDNEAAVIYHNTLFVIPNRAIIDQLEARGIRVHCKNYITVRGEKIYPNLEETVEPYHIFSEHPEAIASSIISAIKNPKLRLIIFPNGGNGMAEIVDLINQERTKGNLPQRNDMFFVGFSDTEKAANYLAHNCGFGQAIISSRVTGENLEEILNSITSESFQKQNLQPINIAAKNSDRLQGNLISASCDEYDEGYSRIEPAKGDVVFFENFPRNFREQLEIYGQKNLLENVRAFVLSSNFSAENLDKINRESEIIFTKYHSQPIPIFHGIDCGHGIKNEKARPLSLQTHTSIKKNGEDFFIEISNLRTEENIRNLANNIAAREPFIRFQPSNRIPEEYRAQQNADEIFCHAIHTSYGHRAEGIKDFIRENSGKFSVKINMPDFRDFKPAAIGVKWLEELTPEQKEEWLSSQQIKAIQMCLMDLKISGYTENINQISITSRRDFSDSVKDWLRDFQKRILPNISCQTEESFIANPQEISLKNSIDEKFFNQEKMLHKNMIEALDLATTKTPCKSPSEASAKRRFTLDAQQVSP